MQTRHAIPIIVIAELFGASLWFSANAVADALHRVWGMTNVELGYLTSSVQLGFICGTLLLALFGFADRFSASRIFASCALLGALVNAAFASAAGGLVYAMTLRFVTGLALAGVYPIGMKLVVSWEPRKAGTVLGWLVGMLVLGTGLPHFVRGIGVTPTWQGVIYAASALAVVAAVMVWRLGDGPHHGSRRSMQWGAAFKVFAIADFRAAALGYFGHMWELYAFWAITPLLVAQLDNSADAAQIYLAAAGIFLAGGIGCIGGGFFSHRWGQRQGGDTCLGRFSDELPGLSVGVGIDLWRGAIPVGGLGTVRRGRFAPVFRLGHKCLPARQGRRRAGLDE